MKRIALLTLIAFAGTHAVLGEDKPNVKKVAPQRRTIAAARVHPNQTRNFSGVRNQNVVRGNQLQAAGIRQGNRPQRIVTSNNSPVINAPNVNRSNHHWNGNGNGNGNVKGNHSGNWNNNAGNNHNWNNHNGNWNGGHHANWNRNRHDRSWWRNNFTRFALFGGGYYYWNSGYWYPAYGYDPYFSSYSYDAPIYAYNDQDPGQVISNVQVELQRRGYNPGGVDGTYGPATRSALLRYQTDNGLPATGEIDQDTLGSLGLQ